MTLQFGTDGVRGVANAELTPELALGLGRAAARVLGGRWVVAADTRRSSPMLQGAFVAGLNAEGADAVVLGVAPTPAVAFVAQQQGWAGAVISASHNPFPDNGIKLFAPGGLKLSDEVERDVEAALADPGSPGRPAPVGAAVGGVTASGGHLDSYLDHLAAAVDGRYLTGLRVVLDCANGAACALAPQLFRRLGAEVLVVHDRPDGTNINDGCGATSPAALQEAVRASGADAGLAFDGDADRLIAVDHEGRVVDGDQLLVLFALDRQARGLLAGDTVVVTVMSNLGLHHAMARAGIRVIETPVGDRNVLEVLEQGGFSLGGEQSGHVILRDLATTGDGLLAGAVLLDVVGRAGEPLAHLAGRALERVPQVLVNVPLDRREPSLLAAIESDLAAARARLGSDGRVLVRPSGTEPLVRVMVEAPTLALAQEEAARLAAAVTRATGG